MISLVNYHGKLSEYDLFLELEAFSEGRSCHAWRCFGAHADEVDGQSGCTFRVWAPNAKQVAYITRLVTGVNEHAAELDGYIAKYAKNWKFSRIPLVASAIMRVAMYEILYMQDIPNGAAINEAVEIAKKYETPETVKFINGILGSFAREEISQ